MGLISKDVYVCIDCEFTGLDADQDRIIEVAVVRFTVNGVIDQYESLVDPQRDIPENSIAIHHITPDMVQGKPTIDKLIPEIVRVAGNYPIVGHGVAMDVDMIVKAADRAGVPCSLRRNVVIDTLRLGRLYGESPDNSLEQLRKHFNIQPEGAHRAMSDVLVNVEVFKKLVTKFKTTEQILDRLQQPIEMRLMPLGKHKGRPFKEVPVDYLRWAANKDFDMDLLFSIRSELKRRKQGSLFSQSVNPFQNL
jgi:DNA polymerase-3 subunit epsilon